MAMMTRRGFLALFGAVAAAPKEALAALEPKKWNDLFFTGNGPGGVLTGTALTVADIRRIREKMVTINQARQIYWGLPPVPWGDELHWPVRRPEDCE